MWQPVPKYVLGELANVIGPASSRSISLNLRNEAGRLDEEQPLGTKLAKPLRRLESLPKEELMAGVWPPRGSGGWQVCRNDIRYAMVSPRWLRGMDQ